MSSAPVKGFLYVFSRGIPCEAFRGGGRGSEVSVDTETEGNRTGRYGPGWGLVWCDLHRSPERVDVVLPFAVVVGVRRRCGGGACGGNRAGRSLAC